MDGKIKEINMDQVEIIQLPIENWREYKELRLRALQTDPQAFLSAYSKEVDYPDEKWQQRLQTANEGKTNCMVFARLGGKLVGMVGFYRNNEGLSNHFAEIWGVYVDPEQRGKGIAKQLFASILQKLEQNPDVNLAKLEVNTDQESAKKLYSSFGFSETTTSQIQLGDRLTHQISAMEKHLRNN